MYLLEKEQMTKLIPLFNKYNNCLIFSCLQGYMGNVWTDNINNPESAQIRIGDFSFFVGLPNIELVNNISKSFTLAIPENKEWEKLIEQKYQNKFYRFMRYSTKEEYNIFDKFKLQNNIEKLDPEYQLRRIDNKIYQKVLTKSWTKDFCSLFPNYDFYNKHGLGFVIMHNDKIVSGASSYVVCNNKIEIEIDTHKDYQRKGLATICASKLILECLNKNIYPSWDAANKLSLALAEKLGYHFEKEYVTYQINL